MNCPRFCNNVAKCNKRIEQLEASLQEMIDMVPQKYEFRKNSANRSQVVLDWADSASTHPCLVDDTKKGSGQKDQHLSASEGDSGQSGQRTDKPCWNCGQHKEICICDTL